MTNVPSLSKAGHLDSRENAPGCVDVCVGESSRGIAAVDVEGSQKSWVQGVSRSATSAASCKSDEDGLAMLLTAGSRGITIAARPWLLKWTESEATSWY